MAEPVDRSRAVALSLMRLALPLLDRCDEGLGAARLQHAIDTVERTPIAVRGDDVGGLPDG